MKFDKSPSVGGGGDFLKLKNAETSVGIFRGAVYEYSAKWNGQKTVQCEPTEKGCSFRFRVNFVVNENGAYVPKVWEQGATVYNQLKALNADYPLETTVVKITRSGSTLNDTSYTILPMPNGALTPEKEAAVGAVKLADLTEGLSPLGATPGEIKLINSGEELPF